MLLRAGISQLFCTVATDVSDVFVQGSVRQTPMYNYILEQYRAHEVTGAKYCKQQNELKHIGQTYLCLLESTARQQVPYTLCTCNTASDTGKMSFPFLSC